MGEERKIAMAVSILIIDNDEITRDVLARLVAYRLPNAILHVTAEFDYAKELCASCKVDIVITTTSMPPDRSGNMLRSLREMPYDPVKIIIMTSSGGYRHLEELYTATNTYLIPKPINMDHLIRLLQERIAEIEANRVPVPAMHAAPSLPGEASGRYRVLLVETDHTSRELLEKHIRKQFPHLDVHAASTPEASLQLLKKKVYDIVICDAFLRYDDRIAFIGDICTEGDILLIVISGETEITKESFAPHINEECIHNVLYKPLDFKAFFDTMECALLRLQARQTAMP